MQIAQYLNMISIQNPPVFGMIYSKADLMSNVNLNFTFIANPFQSFAVCSQLKKGTLAKQLLSPSFVYNTGNQMFIWGLLATIFSISVLVNKHFPKKCIKIRKFFREIYDSFFYSLPIEMFNEIFMTVLFYSFLSLFQAQYVCYTYYIDLFFSAAFMILCGLFYVWINSKIPVNHLKMSVGYKKKFGSVCRDVPLQKGYFALKLLTVSLSFRITYSLCLASLLEYPIIQASFAILLNGLVIL